MATVAGIRFKKAGKLYYFDPTSVWPKPGDQVVVETARGIELGETVTGAREVPDEQIVSPLKKVLRLATPEDVAHAERTAQREREAFEVCQQKIRTHNLEMKLVDVEFTFDGAKVIFYFTANGRVDFRDLVKDLAVVFKTRIELRQIGVRDEAKMLGGLGACGRPICCGAFLSDFQPVSIKMAKEQNLSLNPTKISGQCGRLMCCLKYEQDNYETTLKRVPRIGREVITPDGPGIVVDIMVIREKIKVRLRLPDDSYDMREYPIDDVRRPAQGAESQLPAQPAPQPERVKAPDAPPPTEEKREKRRPPRPKGPKQSYEQFFGGINAAPEAAEAPAQDDPSSAHDAVVPPTVAPTKDIPAKPAQNAQDVGAAESGIVGAMPDKTEAPSIVPDMPDDYEDAPILTDESDDDDDDLLLDE